MNKLIVNFLIIFALATLLQAACKGPECKVTCTGHECSCILKKDAIELPETVSPTKLPWDVVLCDISEE